MFPSFGFLNDLTSFRPMRLFFKYREKQRDDLGHEKVCSLRITPPFFYSY
jgi:hypothetical protein